MNHFVEKLHLKELAEENIFFAKRDAELIKALQDKKLATFAECGERKEGARRNDSRIASQASPTSTSTGRLICFAPTARCSMTFGMPARGTSRKGQVASCVGGAVRPDQHAAEFATPPPGSGKTQVFFVAAVSLPSAVLIA